ncbi:MAG: cardiolipin synthase [Cardiobacteriaceae bacterium]|nr:cardiolipin synthase [Cardiobacteriaceae bacterium]
MTLGEWLILGHFSLNVLFAMRVIYSRKSSSAALAWLVVLFALPYVGTLLYLLIGEPRLGNRRARRKQEMTAFYDTFRDRFVETAVADTSTIAPRFAKIAHLSRLDAGFTINDGNDAKLLTDTDAMLEAFIADIDRAEVSCLLMFYIVDGAGRVAAVLEALMRAASRGVSCQLLADAVGSSAFFKSEWPERLRASGVAVTEALPVGFFKTLFVRSDLRNHRKLLIVDYQIAYTGSYNLVDPATFKQDSGVGQWVDAMLRLEGPVARVLAGVYYADWAVENDDNLKATIERIEGYLQADIPDATARAGSGAALQVIPSAPDENSYVVYDTLMCALYAAQESIVITTPYFVPDEALLDALQNAARRGVAVTLMVPALNDSKLVGYASKAYYQPLLSVGVRIEKFTGGLLHSKTVVIDNQYALFGTVNMDMRSFYLNMELSLAVYDAATVGKIAALQHGYREHCEPLSRSKWAQRPRLQRFLERCVRLVSPLL